jgi:hypothetical protein
MWDTFIAWLLGRIDIPGGVAVEVDEGRIDIPGG